MVDGLGRWLILVGGRFDLLCCCCVMVCFVVILILVV